MVDLASAVPAALLADPSVERVDLIGSRASGEVTSLSDWDFLVFGEDPAATAARLPDLARSLLPLATGWDPNGERPTCFLLLAGPMKVDLILPQLHQPAVAPPHRVDADSLSLIDHHFWDWILWLGSKQLRGETRRVGRELAAMQRQLLGPLGVRAAPEQIGRAVEAYRAAYASTCRRLGVPRELRLDDEVSPALRRHGLLAA